MRAVPLKKIKLNQVGGRVEPIAIKACGMAVAIRASGRVKISPPKGWRNWFRNLFPSIVIPKVTHLDYGFRLIHLIYHV